MGALHLLSALDAGLQKICRTSLKFSRFHACLNQIRVYAKKLKQANRPRSKGTTNIMIPQKYVNKSSKETRCAPRMPMIAVTVSPRPTIAIPSQLMYPEQRGLSKLCWLVHKQFATY